MFGEDSFNLDRQLIKKALQEEFDALEIPSPKDRWPQTEEQLNKQKQRQRARSVASSRLAAVAVIVLAVGLGSWGLYRSLGIEAPNAADLVSPDLDGEEVSYVAEEIAATKEADEVGGTEGAQAEVFAADEPVRGEEGGDHSPPAATEAVLPLPAWPVLLSDQYRLASTIILDEQIEVVSEGALYKGDGAELMLVRTKGAEDSAGQFLGHLSELIGAEVMQTGEQSGYLEFEVFAMPGLAWQSEDLGQALFVVSGNLELEDLEALAAQIEMFTAPPD